MGLAIAMIASVVIVSLKVVSFAVMESVQRDVGGIERSE